MPRHSTGETFDNYVGLHNVTNVSLQHKYTRSLPETSVVIKLS